MNINFPNIVAQEPDMDVLMRYTRYPFSEGNSPEYTMIHIRVGCISNTDGKPHWHDYTVTENVFKQYYDNIVSTLINDDKKSLILQKA